MRMSKINNKGITLIALVLTIILLMILVGISISLIFGPSGIIQKAIESKEIQDRAQIREALEMAKTDILNYDASVYTGLEDYKNYLANLKDKKLNGYKITNITEIKEEENTEGIRKYFEITFENKYVFTAEQKDNDVVINELGNIKRMLPIIKNLNVEGQPTTNSIMIKVEGQYVKSYEFYIKDQNEDTYGKQPVEIVELEDSDSTNETIFEYKGLIQGKKYSIKVVAKNKNGSVEGTIDEVTLGSIPTPTITVSDEETWTQSKTVTISTNSGYTTKYTTNGTDPSATNGTTYTGKFTIKSNCTIKAAYLDNTNQKSISNKEVTKIDTQPPSTPSIAITNIKMTGDGWSYTISTGSSDNSNDTITYTYRDGTNGQVFATTTNKTHNISGKGWFAYGNICVMAEDKAGNTSWSSGIYLNGRRLYIRQLYAAVRTYQPTESEVTHWDVDMGISKGAILAVGVMASTEAQNNYKDPSVWIDRCYLGILGRAADSGGKSNMLSIYNQHGGGGTGMGYVLQAIINSTEAQNIYNNQGIGAGTVTVEETLEQINKQV